MCPVPKCQCAPSFLPVSSGVVRCTRVLVLQPRAGSVASGMWRKRILEEMSREARGIEPYVISSHLNRHLTYSRLDARPTDPLGRESRSGDLGRYLTGIDVTVAGGAGLVVEGRRKAARAGSQCPALYDPPNLMGPTPRTFGMDSRGWKSSRLILRSRRVWKRRRRRSDLSTRGSRT